MSFSPLYKKTFRQLLTPFGYHLHKSLFYKEVNQEQCFFVTAQKERHVPFYQVYLGMLPFCVDWEEEEIELVDLSDQMQFSVPMLLEQLAPGMVSGENRINYYDTRLYTDSFDDEKTLASLQSMCEDIKSIILPYFHCFVDLECFYKDALKRNQYRLNVRDEEMYCLSLKLHRYKEASLCVEYRLSRCMEIEMQEQAYIKRLQDGTFNDVEKRIMKRRHNYVSEQIEAAEHSVLKKQAEFKILTRIQEALQKKDADYLNHITAETEKKSRAYFQGLIEGGK